MRLPGTRRATPCATTRSASWVPQPLRRPWCAATADRSSSAYYTLVVIQQAVFNAVFHAGFTLAFREYSPGLITSLPNTGLWRGLTRAALAESRVAQRDLSACIHVAGAVHAAVVARQVFFLGVTEA